jgi:hypothetical protein
MTDADSSKIVDEVKDTGALVEETAVLEEITEEKISIVEEQVEEAIAESRPLEILCQRTSKS